MKVTSFRVQEKKIHSLNQKFFSGGFTVSPLTLPEKYSPYSHIPLSLLLPHVLNGAQHPNFRQAAVCSCQIAKLLRLLQARLLKTHEGHLFQASGKKVHITSLGLFQSSFQRGLEFCHPHCEGYTPSSFPSSLSSFSPFFLPSFLPPSSPPPLPQSTSSLSPPPLSYLQTS